MGEMEKAFQAQQSFWYGTFFDSLRTYLLIFPHMRLYNRCEKTDFRLNI